MKTMSLFLCRDWTKGGHWTLLIMTSCSDDASPVFIHVDSSPSERRENDLEMLVDEIKEHLLEVCYPLNEDTANRQSLITNIESSRIIHSSQVNSPKQAGYWECGYHVLHTISILSKNNCKETLDMMEPDNEVVNLHALLANFNASDMRRNMAIQAVTQATEQRTLWIDPPASHDSTSWLPCAILSIIDLECSGVWYRVNFRIRNNSVTLWCQLPDNDCLYWKHTD